MVTRRNDGGAGRVLHRSIVAGVALLAVLLAACGSSSGSKSTTTSSAATSGSPALEGTPWALAPGNDVGNLPPGVVVTALFSSGKVSGSSGCNTYSGSYTLKGSQLTISNDIAGTKMACGPAQTAVETAYLALLPKVASYSISGTTLTLKGADGKTLLTFVSKGPEALVGKWTVIAYYSGNAIVSVQAGSTLTAEFAASTVSGNGGCNTFSGPYTATATTIKIGPLASTSRACADPQVDVQERQYLAALQLASTYAVAGDALDLFRADGGYAVQLRKG